MALEFDFWPMAEEPLAVAETEHVAETEATTPKEYVTPTTPRGSEPPSARGAPLGLWQEQLGSALEVSPTSSLDVSICSSPPKSPEPAPRSLDAELPDLPT